MDGEDPDRAYNTQETPANPGAPGEIPPKVPGSPPPMKNPIDSIPPLA